ncbi:endonuclease [Streptomyces albus subsp. albus]|nr:endonuclease [Streptomyces albus subsp. albus]
MRLGTGIGWRPEIAEDIARLPGIDWVEVVAENICPGHLPDALRQLRERGTTVVPHGVSLGLGGAARPDAGRLAALAERAEALGAPLVTEHIAFVRAGGPLTSTPGIEAGHLLPVPRTREALDVLCANVRIAQAELPVPLALENIAALISWPHEELTEGQFLTELVERTGVRLLIDVANLHTNHVNRGEDPALALDTLPTSAIAYVHVAGGVERDGVWHDSHAHPVSAPVLEVLAELCARTTPPGVLLERDEDFPDYRELAAELDAIRAVTEGAALSAAVTAATQRAEARAVVRAGAPAPATDSASAAPATGTARTTPATGPGPAGPGALPAIPAPRSATPGGGARRTETLGGGAAPDTSVPGDGPSGDGASDSVRGDVPDAVRARLALAQSSLLSALVAGAPAPEGFDRDRLRVQHRALVVKRASVVAKVAPELPEILGDGFRAAFHAYARTRPMTGGYRRDALAFAEHLLAVDPPQDAQVRRRLRDWWLERSGPAPLPTGRMARLARSARDLLRRR